MAGEVNNGTELGLYGKEEKDHGCWRGSVRTARRALITVLDLYKLLINLVKEQGRKLLQFYKNQNN